MLRYRAMSTSIVVLCFLAILPLGVRADLPPEVQGKSLQQAPLEAPAAQAPPSGIVSPLGQQTLESIADACILEGRPTDNFGTTGDMLVGYDESGSPPYLKTARSLVLFDTSVIPGNITINSATLRLYLVNSWDYPDRVRTVTTYRVPSNWSETGITWNNAPQPAEAYGEDDVRHADFRWYEFDVTDLVRAWHGGTYANHGIMIRAPEVSGTDSSRRGFSTREGQYPPQLVVQYDTVTPTATSSPSPTSTPTLAYTATPTPACLWLPFIAKNWLSAPVPTPTATTTPAATYTPTPTATSEPGIIQFTGTTNQGKVVDFDVKPDFSAVTRFRIGFKVVCPGVTAEGTVQLGNPAGWPITDRRFEIRSSAGGGVEDVYTGEFDAAFSSAQGTWLRWLVTPYPSPQPVCSGTGTWTASR